MKNKKNYDDISYNVCGNLSSHDSLDFIFHFLNVHSNEVEKEKKVVNCHIYIRIHMNMLAIKWEKTLSYMMILHAKDILLITFAGNNNKNFQRFKLINSFNKNIFFESLLSKSKIFWFRCVAKINNKATESINEREIGNKWRWETREKVSMKVINNFDNMIWRVLLLLGNHTFEFGWKFYGVTYVKIAHFIEF